MILRECRPEVGGQKVSWLKDRYNTGFAGKGYGGDRLFVVALIDCMSPSLHLVRADTTVDAIETAVECLSETVENSKYFAKDYGIDYHTLMQPGPDGDYPSLPNGLTSSPSGRLVSSDDDIRVWQIAGPEEF